MAKNKFSPLAQRIRKVVDSNPIWELMEDLVKEGYDETTIRPFLKEDSTLPEPAALTLINYMRDVKHGIKKPLLWR